LFVAATDLGDVYGGARLTSHTLVEISVIDVNDHAPTICLRHGSSLANHTTRRPTTSTAAAAALQCRNGSAVTVVAETVDRNA